MKLEMFQAVARAMLQHRAGRPGVAFELQRYWVEVNGRTPPEDEQSRPEAAP